MLRAASNTSISELIQPPDNSFCQPSGCCLVPLREGNFAAFTETKAVLREIRKHLRPAPCMLRLTALLLLACFVAVSNAACSLSITTIPTEISPKYVHGASGATFNLRITPTIINGPCTTDQLLGVRWILNDVNHPNLVWSTTGFSSSCLAATSVGQNVNQASGSYSRLFTIGFKASGCGSGGLGTIILPFTFLSHSAGYQSSVRVDYPWLPSASTPRHTVLLTWLAAGSVTVIGDPVISGFHNQSFEFTGKAGRTYHIYSDPYVSVNSMFAPAKPSQTNSTTTVMDKIFVQYGTNHSLSFSAWSRSPVGNVVTVAADSDLLVLLPDDAPHTLGDCSWLSWDGKHLTFALGGQHFLVFTIQSHANKHINTSFVNLNVDASLLQAHASDIGGLIGWTTQERHALKVHSGKRIIAAPQEDDYATASLFSNDAKSSTFRAQHMPCRPVLN